MPQSMAAKITLWSTLAVLGTTLILSIVTTVLTNNLSANVSNCTCTQTGPGNLCPFLATPPSDNDKKFSAIVVMNYLILAMLVVAGILVLTRNFLVG
jgi:uncharacterized YccA/Bax inhibitor family protein